MEITVRLMKQLEEMNKELETILTDIELEHEMSDSHMYQKQTLLIKIRGLKRHYMCLTQNSDAMMGELQAFIHDDEEVT